MASCDSTGRSPIFGGSALIECVNIHDISVIECVNIHDISVIECANIHDISVIECISIHDISAIEYSTAVREGSPDCVV